MNSENVFTFPPSMCFFGCGSLLIYGNVQRFIENKKYSLKSKVEDAVSNAVQEQDLHIDFISFNWGMKLQTWILSVHTAFQIDPIPPQISTERVEI
jgi:hypothetical protein